MSAVLEENTDRADDQTAPPVVVVGTGPVGIRFVEELLRRNPHTPLVIYGNEPWEPYNRVRLASLLSGELNFAAIQNPLKLMTHHRVVQHHDCEIVAIDRANKTVYDRLGNCQRYSQLVLATGSRPHIPSIEGIHHTGIHTFLNHGDRPQLMARRSRSRRAGVQAGG